MSLKRLAVSGGIWNVGTGIAQTIVRLAASMVLARVLDPFDFGIMGMCMIVVSFLNMIGNAGIGAGIIAKKDCSREDLATAFWFMAAFRILLFAITCLIAPIFSLFFNEPRLTDALRAASLVFIISIFSSVSGPLLTKDLRFKTINIINFTTVLIESLLAIFLALKFNLHYWSLIIAMIVSCFLSQIFFVIAAKWKPIFSFSQNSLSFFKKYIIHGIGSSLSIYFLGHADYLVVGRVLGTTSLGFYEFSYRIPHLIRIRFAQPLSSVLFPVFAKSEDRSASLHGLYTVIKINTLFTSLFLIFLAIFSKEVILFLWGQKWVIITPLLPIASVGALIDSIISPRSSVFLACGRPDLNFKANFLHAIFTVLLLLLLTPKYGLIGAALAVLFGLLVPCYFFILSLRFYDGKLRDIAPFVFSVVSIFSFIAMFLKVFIFPFFESINFFLAVFLVGFLYLLMCIFFVFVFYRSFLHYLCSLLKEAFS